MTVQTINRFDEDTPFTLARLNDNFQRLVAAVNTLAGEQIVQLGTVGGDDGSGALPITGGTLLGQLAAPSVVVGPAGGTQYPVVTTNDAPTASVRGAVLRAAAIASVSTSISNPPTQAEVTALKTAINDILAAARTAGWLAT